MSVLVERTPTSALHTSSLPISIGVGPTTNKTICSLALPAFGLPLGPM